MKRMHLALAGLAVAAMMSLGVSDAEARRGGRSHYSFGFSTGGYGGFGGYPGYYAPRPVVYPAYSYAPAPVYYAPPVVPAYPVYGGPACGPRSSFSFSYWR